ncbi:hypothetical protein Vretimale_19226 [Volvox reticuliferus]|uniref:PWWP domain-containing protein n=1 Tax=Volvox reticuliferus TaxID=1737510 RepID=A0A8J4D4P4_9CHLO|nr:hypothetical protein Vretifemale_20302 [Volvox reticuliferus]GIM16607.1 hypothetical protein Vretimale_19226 [Volvox reticuliferus]
MFKVGDIVAGVPPSLSYTWPAQVADINHAPEEIREELDSQLDEDKDSVLLRFLGSPTFEYAVCQEKCVAFIQDDSNVDLLDVPRTGKHRKSSLQAIDEVRQLLRQRRQLDTQMHQGTQPVCLDLRDRNTWPADLRKRALLSPPRTLTPDECTRTSASSALGNLLAAARGGRHPMSPETTWDRLVYSRNVAKGKQLLERVRATSGNGADTLHVQRQAGPVLKSRVEPAPAFDLDTSTSTISSDGWAVNADERPTKWQRVCQGAAASQGQPSGQLAAAARPLVGAADLGGSSQPPCPRQDTAGRQSAPLPEAPELVLGIYQKQQVQVQDAFETHQSEVLQEPEPQPMGTAADMANTDEWDNDIWDDDEIITRPQQQVESGSLADGDDELDDEVEDDDVDIALAALLGWSQRDYRGKSHAGVQVNGQGQGVGMDLDKLKPSAPRGANQQPEDARDLNALARDGQVAETASPLAAVASRPMQFRSAEPHAGSCAVPTRMQRAPSPAWPPVAANAAAVEEMEKGPLGSKRVKPAEVGTVASARVGASAGDAEGPKLSEALPSAGQKDDHKGAGCKGDADAVVGAAGTALGSQSQSTEAEETQTSADAISDAVLGSLKRAHSQGSLWRRTPSRSLRAVPLVPGAAPGTRKIASCLSAGTSAAAVGVSLHYAETNVPVLNEGRSQLVAAPTAETASSGLQQPEAGAEPSGEPSTVGDYQKCTEAAGPVDIRDPTYATGVRGAGTSRDQGPVPVPGSTAADLGSGVHWQAVSELPSRVEGYRGLHLSADDVLVGSLKLLRQLARDPVAVMNRNCTPRLELLHNATLLLCREVCFANSHLAKEGSLGHRVEKVLRLAGEWHGAEEEHQRHQQQPQNGNLTAASKKDTQTATHQQQQSPRKLQKKASVAAVGNEEDVAMGVPHKVRRRDEEALGRGTAKGNYASMAGSVPPADVEPKASAQSDANRGRVARAPSLAADVTTAAGSLVSSGQTKPTAAKGAVSAVPAQLSTGGASLQDEEVVDLAAMEQPLRRIVSIAARNPCSDGVRSGVPLAQQHAATTAAASLHRRPGANPSPNSSPRIGGLTLSSFVSMKSTTASRMQPVGATKAVPTARLPPAVRPVGEQALGQAPTRAPKQHALPSAQQPPSVIKRPQCPAPIQGGASGIGQLGGGSCERLLIWFGKGVPMPTETTVRNVVMMVIRSDPARRLLA